MRIHTEIQQKKTCLNEESYTQQNTRTDKSELDGNFSRWWRWLRWKFAHSAIVSPWEWEWEELRNKGVNDEHNRKGEIQRNILINLLTKEGKNKQTSTHKPALNQQNSFKNNI